jgi:hypothetical protein
MINEHDRVVLNASIPGNAMSKPGDVGTGVHVYVDGGVYEVEFVAPEGHNLAVVTADRESVRPVNSGEITHAWPIVAA